MTSAFDKAAALEVPGGDAGGPGALSRRRVLEMAAALLPTAVWPGLVVAGAESMSGGTFADLVERARRLAAAPYAPPDFTLPRSLAGLTYDQYRDIRFKPDQALWRDQSPYEVQLFHMGRGNRFPVRVSEMRNGAVEPVPYVRSLFDFGANVLAPGDLEGLGFAGVRFHYPLNSPTVMDELAVFQGASYFRVLGAGCRYGVSARGIAVDTAVPTGEEFPVFTHFFLEKPLPGSDRLRLFALLDGPSLAGAYAFVIRPGATTRVTVTCRLFPRRAITQLGIAPLTSMFAFGPADRAGVDDFRPRVHDSDGLALHTGSGEWVWRPISNPERVEINVFMDDNPRGFGLLQRARGLSRFEDLEARYDLRPSVWIRPAGGWRRGSVRLIEIHTPNEYNDNIVAFWVPEEPVTAGRELGFSYDMEWGMEVTECPLARVVSTAIGRAVQPEGADGDSTRERKVVVEFAGTMLETTPVEQIAPVLWVDHAKAAPPVVERNPESGAVRVSLDVVPAGAEPVNVRLALARGSETLSETWTYQWRPAAED